MDTDIASNSSVFTVGLGNESSEPGRSRKQNQFFMNAGGGVKGSPQSNQQPTSQDRTSGITQQVGLVNSTRTLCYINGTLRMLFYATGGSLDCLLKKIGDDDDELQPNALLLRNFVDELKSLWSFLSEQHISDSYNMMGLFNTFVECAESKNLGDRAYWLEQQDTGDFLRALFAILKNPDLHEQGVVFGNTGIERVIYTKCSHCNNTQDAATQYTHNHTLTIPPITTSDSSHTVHFETILNHKMKSIHKESEQPCDLCSVQKKNRKLEKNCSSENGNNDEETNEASENQDKKSVSIRDCYFKSNYNFGTRQKYVLVSMGKVLRKDFQSTRLIHYKLPVGDFNLRGYGWFKVWAALLYTGQKAGNSSSGHYYVMNDNGIYDDEIVNYNPKYFDNLKKKGFHTVRGGNNGYIVMLVLKRSDSINKLPPPLNWDCIRHEEAGYGCGQTSNTDSICDGAYCVCVSCDSDNCKAINVFGVPCYKGESHKSDISSGSSGSSNSSISRGRGNSSSSNSSGRGKKGRRSLSSNSSGDRKKGRSAGINWNCIPQEEGGIGCGHKNNINLTCYGNNCVCWYCDTCEEINFSGVSCYCCTVT